MISLVRASESTSGDPTPPEGQNPRSGVDHLDSKIGKI